MEYVACQQYELLHSTYQLTSVGRDWSYLDLILRSHPKIIEH